MLIKKKYNYTFQEIRLVFDLLNKKTIEPGLCPEYCEMLLKNLAIFNKEFLEIEQQLYYPERDEKFQEYNEELKVLMIKYADRDASGNVIMNNKQPQITEMIVEFNKELEVLNEKHKDILEMAKNSVDYNNKLLQNTKELEVYTWSTSELFPKEISPIFHFYFNRETYTI